MLSSVIVSPWTGASQTTGLRSMSACVSAHFMSCTFFFQLQLYTCFFPPAAGSVAFKKKTCFRFGWLYFFTAWNVRQNLHYHWVHCAFFLVHFFYLFIYVLVILCDIYCAKLKQTVMQLLLELINCTNIAWGWGLVDFARASCRFRWGQKCREQSCLCNTFLKSESHMWMCSYFYIFSFSCMQQ